MLVDKANCGCRDCCWWCICVTDLDIVVYQTLVGVNGNSNVRAAGHKFPDALHHLGYICTDKTSKSALP